MDEKDKVEISKEEYDRLKGIEEQTELHRAKPFCIYEKVNVPIKVLDGVIIGGVVVILLAVVIGVLM